MSWKRWRSSAASTRSFDVVTLVGGFALAACLIGCPPNPNPAPKPVDPPVAGGNALAQRIAKDPVAVLQEGLDKYDRDVKSYTCTLYKQERIDPKGTMGP